MKQLVVEKLIVEIEGKEEQGKGKIERRIEKN